MDSTPTSNTFKFVTLQHWLSLTSSPQSRIVHRPWRRAPIVYESEKRRLVDMRAGIWHHLPLPGGRPLRTLRGRTLSRSGNVETFVRNKLFKFSGNTSFVRVVFFSEIAMHQFLAVLHH